MPLGHSESTSTATSRHLLERARLGDSSALGRLFDRSLSGLRRWAHRRFPRWLRRANDTADLLQDAILHTLHRFDTLDLQGRRALSAYLRQAVQNRIRDEHRRIARRGMHEVLSEALLDPRPSPFDRAVAGELEEQYRAALAQLRPSDRALIVAHVELDYTHEQLGCMTGRSPNAARMALQRALGRLAVRLRDV
jgi:RNA polymerase sigma factor (sigma-70 family)